MRHFVGFWGILLLFGWGELFSQSGFNLVPVTQTETSYNTVTCTAVEMDSRVFVYSGGDGSKIDVFSVDPGGQLASLASYQISSDKKGVRGLITDTLAGKHFLFAGLKGGNAVEVFEINADGTLRSVFVLPDTDSTYLTRVITLQVVHMGADSYLFAGGLENPAGLSSFRIFPDGRLEHVQSVQDNSTLHTDGIIGMSLHRIGGNTYLFTGGFQDNGLSSFQVFENGHFENISNIPDNEFLYLNGAYPVISSTLADWNFVVVGHRHHSYYNPTPWVKDRFSYFYHGDAVSVFWVNEEGELLPRSVFKGNSQTMIKGQTRLQRLPLDQEKDLIAVATR
ncbi:MAG: stress protein, partial [Bacteroidota bacterium]